MCGEVLAAFGLTMTKKHLSSFGRVVNWQRPSPGWVTLDVDGSALQQVEQTGFRGLVRDEDNFFMEFYGALGASTVWHAKISALVHGLEFCWEKGY